AADMDSYLYDIPAGTRGSDQWQDELDQRAEDFADACSDSSGDLLQYITTDQSSRDLDLLRAVLGDEKLNYLGFSYGTFLGATYAKNFPENVGHVVLDGAIDPSSSATDVGVGQAEGFENALRAYMQSCLDGDVGECPFTGSVDDAMGDVSDLLASVDANPLQGSDGRQVGGDTLFTAIATLLYSEGNWPTMTQVLTDVLGGGADYALNIADFYNSRDADGTYTDNQNEAFTAYNCMDYPEESDADEDAINAEIAEKAPTIAPYWSGSDPCMWWPYPPTGTREKITADGAAPIVVVGTTGDPATPYKWAQSLADQLSSGVLLTYEGEGHTAYGGQSECIDSAVNAFFLDDTVPEDGTTCQ
ncbi:MAG: alpha/beta hydrolase, partial [Microbacterium sp.]